MICDKQLIEEHLTVNEIPMTDDPISIEMIASYCYRICQS